MPTVTSPETISVPDAARKLGVSSWTIYRRIREDAFPPAVHIGKTIRVSVKGLQEYIRTGGAR